MMPPTNRAAWLLHPSGPSPPRQAEPQGIPLNPTTEREHDEPDQQHCHRHPEEAG